MNLNKVYLIGRLTKDPEIRTTTTGQTVAQISLATNRVWYNDAKQKQESTEFHNIVAWSRLAEIVNQYSRKGSILLVEGRLQTRNWKAPDGTTKYKTEIVAESIQLGPRTTPSDGSSSYQARPAQNTFTSASSPNMPISESVTEKIETINLDEFGNPLEEVNFDNISSETVPF
ncbi:MAG TPA: single-stranded DNA-binding protein [bacterium]|nr:single-stranded DNA-binding protein [bacterium]